MRDWFKDGNTCCCESRNNNAIIGIILNGKTYKSGNVMQEKYDEDMKVLNDTIMNKVGTKVFIQDTEPESKNTIWIRPVNLDPINHENLLVLNPEPENYRFRASINGTAYGIENAVSDENQLNKKNYLFDIIK